VYILVADNDTELKKWQTYAENFLAQTAKADESTEEPSLLELVANKKLVRRRLRLPPWASSLSLLFSFLCHLGSQIFFDSHKSNSAGLNAFRSSRSSCYYFLVL